jgi:hypothetical protein
VKRKLTKSAKKDGRGEGRRSVNVNKTAKRMSTRRGIAQGEIVLVLENLIDLIALIGRTARQCERLMLSATGGSVIAMLWTRGIPGVMTTETDVPVTDTTT